MRMLTLCGTPIWVYSPELDAKGKRLIDEHLSHSAGLIQMDTRQDVTSALLETILGIAQRSHLPVVCLHVYPGSVITITLYVKTWQPDTINHAIEEYRSLFENLISREVN